MVRFWTPPGCSVSLGVVMAPFNADRVVAELRRAVSEGDQWDGQDQLTVLDPALDPDHTTLQGLMRIAAASRRLSTEPPFGPVVRSVFVAEQGQSRRATEVYIALRKQLRGPQPRYDILNTVPEACSALDVPDMSRHFRPWPELAGFLTPQ